MQKCRSENSLVSNPRLNPIHKLKHHKIEDLKKRLSKIGAIVNCLQSSILQSNEDDRKLLMLVQTDNLKNQKLAHQLDEARKGNTLLLNALQLEGNNADQPKSRGQLDYLSSYSTISMVHLQYKYDELLLSYERLLKVLESKMEESQKYYRENEELRDDVQKLNLQITDNERTITTLCDKYLKLKQRKDSKILDLEYENETLRMAHDQMVNLLNKRSVMDDGIDYNELQKLLEPAKSVLFNETNLCKKLQHQNMKLLQENETLKSQIKEMIGKPNKASQE